MPRRPVAEPGARYHRRYPKGSYWLKRGLHPKAARELAKAGMWTLEDVAGKTREELAAIPGVGRLSIQRLEEVLGSRLPLFRGGWVERGLSNHIARALERAGIDSPEKLGSLTREQFLRIEGLAEVSLRHCEAVLGRRLESPTRFWRDQGLRPFAAYRLAAAGVRTVEELAKHSELSLRRMGLPPGEIAVCRVLAGKARKSPSAP